MQSWPLIDDEASLTVRWVRRLVAVALIATAALTDNAPSQPETAGIERVVADDVRTETTSTGTTSTGVAARVTPAGLGDLDRALDTAALSVGDAAAVDDAGAWFLVGDSTFTAAAAVAGHGSAYPGRGVVHAPFVGAPNPLDLPPPDFDGVVVVGISIWDAGLTDASAYVDAIDRYRQAGHEVAVIATPERYGPVSAPVTSPIEAAELRALNELVDSAVDCPVLPWRLRDVETLGDIEPVDDFIHPTTAGVTQLFINFAAVDLVTC